MDVRGSRQARLVRCAIVTLLCLAGAATAFAQGLNTATLSGTVVDNVGVVPGATVTATSAATGAVRSSVTNSQGVFRLVSLAPGTWAIKVSMEGFKGIDTSVPLNAGEARDLGKLTLSAGGVSETVNVTAEVTPVQTTSSALQKSLTSDLLTTVQVKGRDIFGMLKILPGVVDSQTSRDFTNWASGRYLSINGGNSLNKNTTIDGVPVGEEGGNGTTHITPNIDSIAEVNVISSGYTAENGRMASGQVVMVTKSGTNEFKGSAWYNGRRDWMNKNDYFRIKQNNAKPFFGVDLTGFSVGGPVILPGFNSRTANKKLFFFASSEYTNDIRPTSVQYNNLPTALERAGDFSQTFYCDDPNGDPCTRDTGGNLVTPGSTTRLGISNPYATSGVNDFFCASGTGGMSGVPCVGTCGGDEHHQPEVLQRDGPVDAQRAAAAQRRVQPGVGRGLVGQQQVGSDADPPPQGHRHARGHGAEPADPVQRPRPVRPGRQHQLQQHHAGHRLERQRVPGQPVHRHADAGAQADGRQRVHRRLLAEPLGLQAAGRRDPGERLHRLVSRRLQRGDRSDAAGSPKARPVRRLR